MARRGKRILPLTLRAPWLRAETPTQPPTPPPEPVEVYEDGGKTVRRFPPAFASGSSFGYTVLPKGTQKRGE